MSDHREYSGWPPPKTEQPKSEKTKKPEKKPAEGDANE